MKLNKNISKNSCVIALFASVVLPVTEAIATPITGDTVSGNLIVSGSVTAGGDAWFKGFNIYGGPAKELAFKWTASTTDLTLGALYTDISRPKGRLYWREDTAGTTSYKMAINENNLFAIYKPGTTTAAFTVSPTTGRIDLAGVSGGGIYCGGLPIIALGADATAASADLTFSSLTATDDSYVNGVRLGKGNGSLANNSALGVNTLTKTTGDRNTAVGAGALSSNTSGIGNTAVGAGALYFNSTGADNAAVGDSAGVYYGPTGTAQLTQARSSVYVGTGARGYSATDVNAIVIGATAVSKGSNTTVIGTAATLETHLAGKTLTSNLEVAGQATAGALNVNGPTLLNGQVTLAAPQGDISMGIYGQ
jgi:hypothetical protein